MFPETRVTTVKLQRDAKTEEESKDEQRATARRLTAQLFKSLRTTSWFLSAGHRSAGGRVTQGHIWFLPSNIQGVHF